MMGKKTDKKEIFTVALLAIGFFAIIILYVAEFKYITNTINGFELMKKSLLLFLAIGLLGFIGAYLTKLANKEHIRFHVFFLLVFIGLGPFCASITNRMLTQKRPYSQQFEYLGQRGEYPQILAEKGKNKPMTYWIYVGKDGQQFEYRTTTAYPMTNRQGQHVRMIFNQGFWGYDYFDGKSWEFD